MKCASCSKPAALKGYCRDHFIKYFEGKVKGTIEEFRMLSKKDKVAVGCSGGKDSLTLLYILNKLGYDVTAIAIDEGIKGYRDPDFRHLKEFCKKHKIPYKTYSFREAFGKPLDDMDTEAVGGMPCTTCGAFRRHLLNKNSKDFDKMAVGHNMDDEAQSVLMNLFKGQVYLMPRQGPVTTEIDGFTKRVKPLYFLKEKEVATYAYIKGILDKWVECPNAGLAYRIYLRDLLNEYEAEHPGTKENIVRKHLEIMRKMERPRGRATRKCDDCGEPCSGSVCKACQIKVKI